MIAAADQKKLIMFRENESFTCKESRIMCKTENNEKMVCAGFSKIIKGNVQLIESWYYVLIVLKWYTLCLYLRKKQKLCQQECAQLMDFLFFFFFYYLEPDIYFFNIKDVFFWQP